MVVDKIVAKTVTHVILIALILAGHLGMLVEFAPSLKEQEIYFQAYALGVFYWMGALLVATFLSYLVEPRLGGMQNKTLFRVGLLLSMLAGYLAVLQTMVPELKDQDVFLKSYGASVGYVMGAYLIIVLTNYIMDKVYGKLITPTRDRIIPRDPIIGFPRKAIPARPGFLGNTVSF